MGNSTGREKAGEEKDDPALITVRADPSKHKSLEGVAESPQLPRVPATDKSGKSTAEEGGDGDEEEGRGEEEGDFDQELLDELDKEKQRRASKRVKHVDNLIGQPSLTKEAQTIADAQTAAISQNNHQQGEGQVFPDVDDTLSHALNVVDVSKLDATHMSTTVFSWPHGGRIVAIAGSFNDWKEHIPLIRQENGVFTVVINLPPGTYEYKYIVDGEWQCDSQSAVCANRLGSVNNLCEVAGPKNVIPYTRDSMDFEPDDGMGSGRESPAGEYGQDVPNVWDAKPQRLPPHLLKVTLNAEPENNDPTQLPVPNHVMLNHLYALSIKDNVIVLGSSSRYRKKFVTTVVYKPLDR